mmetsp:Transcript_3196/g.5964  ORF Transcript_3196/g.5964 Transcript_3196/m.5964 type:complete len:404 (+) Transcript_3196:63-1274(+)
MDGKDSSGSGHGGRRRFEVERLEVERQHVRELKERVLDICHGKSGRRYRHYEMEKIPGPMPQSVSSKTLNVLSNKEYWVAEKSDGDRFMLFYSETSRKCYLIGRKFDLRIVPGSYFPNLFRGGDTLIDGELVSEVQKGVERDTYLVFDVVAIRGRSYVNEKLLDRLKQIGGVIGMYRQSKNMQEAPFALQSKTFKKKKHIGEILKMISRDDSDSNCSTQESHPIFWFKEQRSNGWRKNKNDGLIFTPEHGGYMQRECPILKWKFPELQTIDVAIRSEDLMKIVSRGARNDGKEPRIAIYCNGRDPSGRQRSAEIYLRDIKAPKDPEGLLNAFRKGNRGKGFSCIVEVGYDKAQGEWIIYRPRPDKARANFITTCMSTFDALIDNINAERLEGICCGSKKRKHQ